MGKSDALETVMPRCPGKCVRNGSGGPILGSFLIVEPGLQRGSLVEGMSRGGWQEKGEAGFDGNKTENTWDQRSGPHLLSGPI